MSLNYLGGVIVEIHHYGVDFTILVSDDTADYAVGLGPSDKPDGMPHMRFITHGQTKDSSRTPRHGTKA
jgi:hypothetical protein